MPRQFCGVPGLVRFQNGQAAAISNSWGKVYFSAQPPIYGDLSLDMPLVAVVPVVCDNGGGTADGQLAFAAALVSKVGNQVENLGTITAQMNPKDVHTTLITVTRIGAGNVTVHEDWYNQTDPTCCPTGRATTTWTWSDGQLTPGTPDITN